MSDADVRGSGLRVWEQAVGGPGGTRAGQPGEEDGVWHPCPPLAS